MGLVPLAWVLSLKSARRIDMRWLLLAAAFGLSWLADWLGHVIAWTIPGPAYVAAQAALVVWVLAPPQTAARFSVVLLGTMAFAMLTLDARHPDILVHTVGWLGLLTVLWPLSLTWSLRLTLLMAFGLGWLAWIGYNARPWWPSWGIYQGIRALGIGLFCWASWQPTPLRQRA